MTLSLEERIKIVEAINQEWSEDRLARADAIYHPSPDELARILKNCEDMRAEYEFRKDVKTAIWLTALLFAGLCVWWTIHLLRGGLL